MIRRLLILLAIFSSMFVMVPATALAVDTVAENKACETLEDVRPGSCTNANGTSGRTVLGGMARGAVNILSWVVGIAAVLMLINGALQYILSGGDSSKVSNAKNIIMYSLIGIVIVAIAQVIVRLVLREASGV